MISSSDTSEIIVIGGGVMGLFTAFHLAELGVGRIRVLERRYIGAGSSGKSGAILRQHYSHETTVRMARTSLGFYRDFAERYGHDIGFRQTGMLFTCSAADREALEANVALQRRLGVNVEILDAAGLRVLHPGAVYDDDVIGAFEHEAGFVDPALTLSALADLARARGVEIHEGVDVVDVHLDDDRSVRGVRTNDGVTHDATVVVNAGGPWAVRLAARLGLDLPLKAIRPEQAFIAPPPSRGPEPFVAGDLLTGLYWKPEPAGWTRVGNLAYNADAEVDPDDYDEGVSNAFIQNVRDRLSERLPEYANAVSWGGCGALYTVTPDAHALIGPVPGIGGFHVVSGFSGHGFKLGPTVGAGVAAMITGGDPDPLDPAFFAVDRFERGAPVTTSYEYGILG